MYLSHIFYFKESTIITTEKQKKQKYKKRIQKCGGQVASSSIWLCPSNKTKFFFFFFFQLILRLHPYLFAPLQLKGGNLLVLHICFLIFFFFFPSLLLAKNKSLSSSSLKWIYKFKQICFPPKLAANELQKCFFGYSWYGRLFGLRILFVIKFLTNLFSFLSFVIFS